MKQHLPFWILLSLSSWFNTIYAQKGNIRGILKDAYTQQPIKGGYVQIPDEKIRVFTDENGFYSITNLAIKAYRIEFSSAGYRSRIIPNLTTKPNQITNINVVLEPIYLQKGQLGKYTSLETESMAESQFAQSIVNGLNKDQLQKSTEREMSQLLRQIPGVAVNDNRFLNIRGLNQRYNNLLYNNTVLSTTETDTKSFSFDILPVGVLEKVVVFKSPSPELPGEFSGGVVQFNSATMPSQNTFKVEFNAGYRENTTFLPYFQGEQGKNYALGFNNNYQNIPSVFPKDLTTLGGNVQALANVSTLLRNNWTAKESSAIPNQQLLISAGIRLLNKPTMQIGNYTSLAYQLNQTSFHISRADYNENQSGTESPIYAFKDAQYSQNTRVGIVHNWAFHFKNSSINFNNLLSQSSNGRTVIRTGNHFEFNYLPNDRAFDQIYNTNYVGQLTGNHVLGQEETQTVHWTISYNHSVRDQPDYRRYRSDLDASSQKSTLYVPTGRAFSYFLGRFSSLQTDNNLSGNLSYLRKFELNRQEGRQGEWQVGGFSEIKKRDFNARNLGYIRSNSNFFNTDLLSGSIEDLFLPINQNPVTGIRIDELTNASDRYQGNMLLFGGYIKANLPLTNKLSVTGGIRVENGRQQLNSNEISNEPVIRKLNNLNILPSVNASYNLSDITLLRFAYGQTLNRPEFRELAPFNFFDWDYNYIFKGNELQQAQIHNFDFRWERYPSPTEVISIAAFYKFFQNPIETIAIAGSGSGGSKTFTYTNARNATTIGVEAEVRKSLSPNNSSNLLKNLNLVFSGSLVFSSVSLGKEVIGQASSRPLQGQAPFLINAGLNFTNESKSFQTTLFYNVMGRKIFAVGFDGYPDLYEMPRNVIDLHFSQKIGRYLLLRGSVEDVLNQSVVILQDGNQDGKFQRSNDQIIQKYYPGRLINVGIGIEIK